MMLSSDKLIFRIILHKRLSYITGPVMNPLIIAILITSLFAGCAPTRDTKPVKAAALATSAPADAPESLKRVRELQNIDEKQLDTYGQEKGVVIAKTDFKGALEQTYVKLFFQDIEKPHNRFELYIGENTDQKAFPWEAKTVKPGYFYVELPAGKYKISSISIPVGSTQATEKINIDLEVLPEEVTYIGTLQVTGTKEKIKLGGLPVIKPGFEYIAVILNEEEEAVTMFKQRYPHYPKKILSRLMRLNHV